MTGIIVFKMIKRREGGPPPNCSYHEPADLLLSMSLAKAAFLGYTVFHGNRSTKKGRGIGQLAFI